MTLGEPLKYLKIGKSPLYKITKKVRISTVKIKIEKMTRL